MISFASMYKRRRYTRKKRQKGGIFPLAALIPAFVAAGKAAALGAVSGGAGYGAKKALEAATRRKRKRTNFNPRTEKMMKKIAQRAIRLQKT